MWAGTVQRSAAAEVLGRRDFPSRRIEGAGPQGGAGAGVAVPRGVGDERRGGDMRKCGYFGRPARRRGR